MLGDEDWMPAHRRLAAVVQRLGRSEPLPNEIARVVEHKSKPSIGEIVALFVAQAEAASKSRGGKT